MVAARIVGLRMQSRARAGYHQLPQPTIRELVPHSLEAGKVLVSMQYQMKSLTIQRPKEGPGVIKHHVPFLYPGSPFGGNEHDRHRVVMHDCNPEQGRGLSLR